MIKIPANYCVTCHKQALDKVDLETDGTELIAKLKRALPVAGALGGRDAMIAEVCYMLDLPVPPDMMRQELTEATARVLLSEIGRRFGNMLANFVMNMGGLVDKIGRRYMDEMEYRNKRRQRDYYVETMEYRTVPPPVMDYIPEKHYYVPEYTVKPNRR